MTYWPGIRLAEATWVCVDVETTGLEVGEGHRVCEVAAAKGGREGAVGTLASLANPQRPLDPAAARVNRLSEADLAGAPLFADIAADVHSFLSGAVLVAHNAPFDVGFLESEFARCGLRLPPAPIVDTTVIAQSVLGLPVRNLGGVARALGLSAQPTHRALDDARATREVLLHGLSALAARGARTVGDVVEALLPPIHLGLPLPDDPLAAIRDALVCGADLRIAYRGGSGASERVIRPIRLEAKGYALLLAAFCRQKVAPRNFRVDRIASAEVVSA